MSDNPYNENNLSVAQAKAYIGSIDMNGISAQIQHYQSTARVLGTLAEKVAAVNAKLQATWTGSAATAANIQFGTVAKNANYMSELLSGQVVPALQNVHAAGQQAKTEIAGVKDEMPVNAYQSSSVKNAAAADALALSTIQQQKEFNLTQRQKAAVTMNSVANTYDSTATTFTTLAASTQDISNTSASNPGGSFNFGSAPDGSYSRRAVEPYHSIIGSAGSKAANVIGSKISIASEDGRTAVQAYVPPTNVAPPLIGISPTTPPFEEIDSDAVIPGMSYMPSELPTGLGVFGESGLSADTRNEITPSSTSFSESAERPGIEQPGVRMLDEGSIGGEHVAGFRYPRDRYFRRNDGDYVPEAWEGPAIGGKEGVLIGQRLTPSLGITSIYDGARDEQGNPVFMMGGGALGSNDEDEEPRSRPGYLKEDPQWWQPEGTYAPPVVE